MSLNSMIKLVKQLYPTGRAFRVHETSNLYKLHGAMNEDIEDARIALAGILNTILPDNDNFTAEDANVWENRLGISSAGSIDDRKNAIMRKLNYPGNTLGRMSKEYFEGQLRAAGFDVRVYANKFSDGMGGYTVINPGTGSGSYTRHGAATHGISVHGTTGFPYNSIVANYEDKAKEATPVYNTSQLKATFFIPGDTFPNFAAVPAIREQEFRKLILTLKGSHLVGYLLINYV